MHVRAHCMQCNAVACAHMHACMQGSQAYAKALGKAGILTADEATTIVDGLGKVRFAACCGPCTVPRTAGANPPTRHSHASLLTGRAMQ
jgi:hypothetical protein